jgi:hypothetical protein
MLFPKECNLISVKVGKINICLFIPGNTQYYFWFMAHLNLVSYGINYIIIGMNKATQKPPS